MTKKDLVPEVKKDTSKMKILSSAERIKKCIMKKSIEEIYI